MSLDFYLEGPAEQRAETHRCGEYGCDHEHTHLRQVRPQYFDANITHNLGKMASEAGIYQALWHPDEATPPMTHARELIAVLSVGLDDLRSRPAHFAQFNAANGWGMYEHFVPFVARCLAACIAHPDALVRTST
jgi:hypothetical protein